MGRTRLLRRRRLSVVPGEAPVTVAPGKPLPRLSTSRSRALLLAVVLSIGAHIGLGAVLANGDVPERRLTTVVRFVNEEPDPADSDPTLDEPVEEEVRILEALPEPGERGPAGEDAGDVVAEGPAEELIEDSLAEEAPEPVPYEPPEEVFGIDLASTVDRGAMAVRVGNSLRTRPGRFVDPDQVRPLNDPLPAAHEPAPPAATEPELPEMPDMPDLSPAPVMQPPPAPERPRMPPPEPVRTVPDKKYRTRVQPAYTELALDREIEGVVVVDVWIRADGTVRKAQVVSGLGYGLDEQVMAAVRRSLFHPVLEDGHPVASRYRLKYRFEMNW